MCVCVCTRNLIYGCQIFFIETITFKAKFSKNILGATNKSVDLDVVLTRIVYKNF